MLKVTRSCTLRRKRNYFHLHLPTLWKIWTCQHVDTCIKLLETLESLLDLQLCISAAVVTLTIMLMLANITPVMKNIQVHVHRWTIVKLCSIQCNVVVWGIDNTVLWHCTDRLLFQTGNTFTVSMPVITSRWVNLTMRRTPAAAAVDPRSPTALAPTRQPRTTQSSRCCNQRTCTAHSVLTTIVMSLVLIMNFIVL